MLKWIYRRLLNATSRPGEKGEYSGGYLQDRVRREVLALCRRVKGRILEVGCGEGLFLAQLTGQDRELEVWGIDKDEARLKDALKRVPLARLSCQDAAGLSFEDGHFDAVICINVLFNMSSMEDVRSAFCQMRRVCKSGGSIIFDFRNSGNPLLSIKYRLAKYYDDTVKGLPLKTYSTKEIGHILSSLNMEIVDKRYVGFNSDRFAAVIIIEAKKIC